MRKLPLLIPLFLIAAACQKTATSPFASATFERSINGSDLWNWDFTNKTADILSFTQTYYTGSPTGGKRSRWTADFVDPQTPVNMSFTFPGTDTSATLPVGKVMSFTYRITDIPPSLVICALDEKGTFYTGSDSTLLDVNIQSFADRMVSGTFSIQLYSPAATVMITQGHFTNVPVTLATQ